MHPGGNAQAVSLRVSGETRAPALSLCSQRGGMYAPVSNVLELFSPPKYFEVNVKNIFLFILFLFVLIFLTSFLLFFTVIVIFSVLVKSNKISSPIFSHSYFFVFSFGLKC